MHYDPMEKHLELMRHAPRTMKYDGSVPFEQWQEAARRKLAELLGLPLEMPESDEFHPVRGQNVTRKDPIPHVR